MPIYEYFCPKCESEFELMRPISKASEPALCPRCGTQGQKLISVFASKVDFALKVPDKGAFRKPAPKRAKRRTKHGTS
jgi:putative FmdB family regulatory protein